MIRQPGKRQREVRIVAMLCAACLLTTGCATYRDKTDVMASAWQRGDVVAASGEATRLVEMRLTKEQDGQKVLREMKSWDGDAVVFLLEQGATLRAAGRLDESTQAFLRADQKMDAAWERPVVEIVRESRALFDNLAAVSYDGYAYDHVMACTYIALNELQMGRLPEARAALWKAEMLQNEYLQKKQKKIEEQQEELQKDQQVRRQSSDARFQGGLNAAYQDLDALVAQYKPYANYRNPLTTYLYALCMSIAPGDRTSDPSNAQAAMQTLAGMVDGNQTVHQDLQLVSDIASGQSVPPTVYVIFETGQAPKREAITVHIPVPTGDISKGEFTYFGASFPKLVRHDAYVDWLTVSANGSSYRTQHLASMDGIIAREFKDELPAVITKTLIGATAKAILIWQAQKQGGWAGTLAGLAYGVATNQADLRSWTTLPKEFQVCRLPAPEDRTVTLSTPQSAQTVPVQLIEGNVILVYVKSIAPGTPLFVWQAKLN